MHYLTQQLHQCQSPKAALECLLGCLRWLSRKHLFYGTTRAQLLTSKISTAQGHHKTKVNHTGQDQGKHRKIPYEPNMMAPVRLLIQQCGFVGTINGKELEQKHACVVVQVMYMPCTRQYYLSRGEPFASSTPKSLIKIT